MLAGAGRGKAHREALLTPGGELDDRPMLSAESVV